MKKIKNPLLITILIILGAIYALYNDEGNNNQNFNNLNSNNNEYIELYYLDVGQADSILIIDNDHNMLIDGGNNEDGELIVNYLKELNIKKLDYIIATHPHEDHIGGLDNVINNFEIKNILMPEVYTTTKTFEDVLDAIENNNLSITIPKIGDKYKLNLSSFEIIYVGKDKSDLNDTSIILNLNFNNNSFLFTGDASKSIEKQILDKNIKADVLKLGHHGSKYSSSKEFLKQVNPKYAIISCGQDNIYKHPNEETLQSLDELQIKYYITKDDGTIKITSDGNNITIDKLKTNTNG